MMVNAPLLPFLFFLAARWGGGGKKRCRKWEGPISTKRDKKILFSRHLFLLLTTRGRCSLPFSKKRNRRFDYLFFVKCQWQYAGRRTVQTQRHFLPSPSLCNVTSLCILFNAGVVVCPKEKQGGRPWPHGAIRSGRGGGGLQREVRCNASHDRHSPLHIPI